MSSCDEALAEYHIAKHEFDTTQSMLIAFGWAAGVGSAVMLAAIAAMIAAIALLAAGPQAAFLPMVLIVLLGIAALASLAALFGYCAVFVYTIKLWRLSQRLDQAYAALWNKCQNEPDRIPTYDGG